MVVSSSRSDASLDEVSFERDSFKRALAYIRDTMGAVCEDFGACSHRSCNDSCGAWMVANEFLNGNYELPDEESIRIKISSNRHGVKNPFDFLDDLDVPVYQTVEKNNPKP